MTLNPWTIFVAALAGWMNRQQQQAIEYLREENRILREKLRGKRLLLNVEQKRRLAAKGIQIGRDLLRQFGTLFSPETILRWQCVRKAVGIAWNGSGGGIARANLDGNDFEVVTTSHAFGVAVDPVGESLYWHSSTAGGLWKAGLDGSDPELILPGSGEGCMALDTAFVPEPGTLSLVVLGWLPRFVAGVLYGRGQDDD